MTVDEERFRIEAGAVITMDNGTARGIEAETQLAFLAVRMVSVNSPQSNHNQVWT